MSTDTTPLGLSELLHVDPLAHAEAVHVPDQQRRVDHVVLAETFERLNRMSPHSLVVLHDEAATGGWSLAAALHAAWERNASAVVVPRPAMTASSAVLAERLGIALLVIDNDPVDQALALAGQVGHLVGGAGAVESIATLLSIYHGVVPATRNLENLDPKVQLDVVAGEPRKMELTAALNNSFGFGGHNVALLFTAN